MIQPIKYPALEKIPPGRLPTLVRAMKRYKFLNRPLLDFIPAISPNLVSPIHLSALARLIERAEREPVRALVSTPPRHGKTTALLHGAAWLLARNPGMVIGYASYNAQLSRSKSREARDQAARAGIKLRDDAQSLGEWRTRMGGGLLASGVGGTWTGHGLNVAIVDDPLANREESESQLIRDNVFDWFTSTLLTRIEPNGSVIVNMARWHGDDLIGRLAREQPGRWEIVNLPALDVEGAPLWPDRWSLDSLREKRAEIGEYDFASLYMGSPRPRGGHLFAEPARYASPNLSGSRIYIGVDPAATAKTSSDYSVAVVAAVSGIGSSMTMDILEVYRAQVELPALVEQLRRMSKKWNAPLLIESVGVGKSVPQFLRQLDGKLRITEVSVKGDKYLRSQPLVQGWSEGRVRVPATDAPWMRPYLTEMLNATLVNDPHDDCADATAIVWNHAAGSAVRTINLDRGPFAKSQITTPTDAFGRAIGA